MLMILFGLAGCGKNYAGKTIAQHFGYFFWDADDVLTEEMKTCIYQRKGFTKEMLDVYIGVMIERITALQKEHKNVIVAQALYNEMDRNKIYEQFRHAIFVHVKADLVTINRRLDKRNNWVDKNYAESFRSFFQTPQLPHETLVNDTDGANIITQAYGILKKNKVVILDHHRIRFFQAITELPAHPLTPCDKATSLISQYLSDDKTSDECFSTSLNETFLPYIG